MDINIIAAISDSKPIPESVMPSYKIFIESLTAEVRAFVDNALMYDSIGMPLYSKELCCQCLAYLLVLGGGDEACVVGKMRGILAYAQVKANIFGGEIPNGEWIIKISAYVKELESAKDEWTKTGVLPTWLESLYIRYPDLHKNYNFPAKKDDKRI